MTVFCRGCKNMHNTSNTFTLKNTYFTFSLSTAAAALLLTSNFFVKRNDRTGRKICKKAKHLHNLAFYSQL